MSDYANAPGAMLDFAAAQVHSVIAAPVHEHGTVVGSIATGSTDSGRRFSEDEQQMLLAYAEQASLTLAAAKTVETMRQAFNDSLTGLANRALFLDRLNTRCRAPSGSARRSRCCSSTSIASSW